VGHDSPLQSTGQRGPNSVVVVVEHSVVLQASQQLGVPPTHAMPPRGGRQAAALRLMLHLVSPRAFVRQQVTTPGRPHVDRRAHACATRAQSGFANALASVVAEQRTYSA